MSLWEVSLLLPDFSCNEIHCLNEIVCSLWVWQMRWYSRWQKQSYNKVPSYSQNDFYTNNKIVQIFYEKCLPPIKFMALQGTQAQPFSPAAQLLWALDLCVSSYHTSQTGRRVLSPRDSFPDTTSSSHTQSPAQWHGTVDTCACQCRPAGSVWEAVPRPSLSCLSLHWSVCPYATLTRRVLPPADQRGERFETNSLFPLECQLGCRTGSLINRAHRYVPRYWWL